MAHPPSSDEILAHLCAKSLRVFIEEVWPIIEPGATFKPGRHIDEICAKLEAVTAGECLRLIVNVPPRHMKSLIISVVWPAWVWLTNPEQRFLCASYADGLAIDDSVKCRDIINSTGDEDEQDGTLLERVGYAGLLALLGQSWELTGDQNEKKKFKNSRQGYRAATSVGGTVTGKGGGVVILDDPNNADDAYSEAARKRVRDWLGGTLASRLNDPEKGAIVVVQQRVHHEDATAYLLAQGGWEHVCLPAEFEPGHPHRWDGDWRTEPGQLLWPEHYGETAVADLKKRMAPSIQPGQLQQRPQKAGGGMFKEAWWTRRWQPDFEGALKYRGLELLHSWDFRFKDSKTTGDYVVGQLWGFHGANAYLLAQVRARLSFTESQDAMRALLKHAEDSPYAPFRTGTAKLVEEKANGSAIIQTLRDEVGGIVAITPTQAKEARAAAVTPLVLAGNVWLPAGDHIPAPPGYEPTSVVDFIAEHAAFPMGGHDDQVDALSQALSWRRPKGEPRKPLPPGARSRPRAVTAGIRTKAV